MRDRQKRKRERIGRGHDRSSREGGGPLAIYLSEWQRLSPAERLRRSWALRRRIPDLTTVHDAKLFPRP